MNYDFVRGEEELIIKNYSAWEFYPGRNRNNNSIFLYEDGMNIIFDLFNEIDHKFDIYGYKVTYNKRQIEKLKKSIFQRISAIENNQNIDYISTEANPYWCEQLNINRVKYKEDILFLLKEFYNWLDKIKHKKLTYVSF
jgi:hypothetical protein